MHRIPTPPIDCRREGPDRSIPDVIKAAACVVRIHDADGKIVKTIKAQAENFGPKFQGFARAVASWSIDNHAPHADFATARIESRTGKLWTTVAPRMVQEASMTGR